MVRLTLTLIIFQEGYGRLEDCRLVHLLAVDGNHRTQLVDQHVELVSPLLLTEVSVLSEIREIGKVGNLVIILV